MGWRIFSKTICQYIAYEIGFNHNTVIEIECVIVYVYN